MALPFILIRIGYFFAESALRSSLTLEGSEDYTSQVTHECINAEAFSSLQELGRRSCHGNVCPTDTDGNKLF